MTTAFIVGAGRSGSTLFYKLLCLHPQVGYISGAANALPGWVPAGYLNRLFRNAPEVKRRAWFEASGNAHGVRRSALDVLVPMPREGERVYARSGLPTRPEPGYRPDPRTLRRLARDFERLRRHCGARVLVSKRIANTRRIAYLQEAFPDARYIHLVRDGRAAVYSLSRVRWWGDWQARNLTPELRASGADPLLVAARGWAETVARVREGLAGVPAGRVLTLRYEDLLADPGGVVGNALDFLGLPPDAGCLESLGRIGILQGREAWREVWTREQQDMVATPQRELLAALGYLPAS